MRRIVLILIFFVLSSGAVHAQQSVPCSGANCNEWVVTTPNLSVPAGVVENSPLSSQAPSASLPTCEKSDDLHCAEECRREFGGDFHTCKNTCLRGRCTKAAPPVKESRDDASFCLESESDSCDHQCSSQPSDGAAAKCRRSCLQAKCPGARKYDTAMEGNDPGTAACRRCEAEHQKRCDRRCRIATVRIPSGELPELRAFGCEKLCMASACGTECSIKNPF